MADKKAELSIGQLISLILVILVIVVVLMSVLNPRIWDWVRALPDYKYNDTDTEIEYNQLTPVELAGICPDASKVGFIGGLRGDIGFREQHVVFLIRNEPKTTRLYWRGTETNAEIWLFKKDKYTGWDWFEKDLLVAKVKEGVIKVEPNLLDLDSEIYQKTRFETQVLELYLLPYLENSYLAFNNQICRVAEPAKLKPAWPGSEEQVIKLYPDLHFKDKEKVVEIRGLWEFVDVRDTGIEFLYLVNEKNYIEVRGYRSRLGYDRLEYDFSDISRIYPDGSIWFPILYKGRDPRNYDYQAREGVIFSDKRENKFPEFLTRFNLYINEPDSPSQAIETNLKLSEEWNYQKLRKH